MVNIIRFADQYRLNHRRPEEVESEWSSAAGSIDWSTAAPSWASLSIGIVIPVLAVVAITFLLDVLLSILVQFAIGHLVAVRFWTIGALVSPLALIGTIGLLSLLQRIFERCEQSGG